MGPEPRSVFLVRAGELVTRGAVTCAPSTPAVEIAQLMSRNAVGSVVVGGPEAPALGIVTDRDLRRLVAEGRDAVVSCARDIMSSPLVAVDSAAFAFEAMLEMTRRGIRHLAVMEGSHLRGVISLYDFIRWQGVHPVLLAREIEAAASLEVLAALGARIADLTHRLMAEGAAPHDVGQLVSELNDRVVRRVLALAARVLAEAGQEAPPVPYCWLSFGSEARREQTLRTDQDNGLVFEDPPEELQERAASYYAALGEATVRGLVQAGVPPCPGDIMASNPRWCRPLSVWREYFRGWISARAPDQVLNASIHFDLRPVAGSRALADVLRGVVREEVPSHPGFLGLLARDVVDRRVALTLLGRIATRRGEPHRGAVDLKGAGTLQLVGAARLHALELGLDATNTIERIRAAEARQLYTAGESREITEAAQHLMRLRLSHQLEQHARGETPDNFVVPAQLSHADRVLLREALRTVKWVQARLRERFATDFAPA